MTSRSPLVRAAVRTACLAGALLALTSPAFPPAPGYTVYGLVRDPFGWTVNSSNAEIIFKNAATGAVVARTKIGGPAVDENYRVMIPLDQQRSGEAYKESAIAEASPIAIEVVLDGVTYYPVETVAAPLGWFYLLAGGLNFGAAWCAWRRARPGTRAGRILRSRPWSRARWPSRRIWRSPRCCANC